MKLKLNHIAKYALSALLALTFAISLPAQSNLRSNDTKIIDALNQLPAPTPRLYNRLMKDISTTGEEGVQILLDMLVKKNESYVPVQYALGGFVNYVSNLDAKAYNRDNVVLPIKALLKKYESGQMAKDLEIQQFLNKQLKTLGYIVAPKYVEPQVCPKDALKNLKAAKSAAKKDNCYKTRGAVYAALRTYIESAGVEAAQKEIIKALRSDEREMRFAALYAIDQKQAKELNNEICGLLLKVDAEAQQDILYYLGELNDASKLSVILPFLSSDNNAVVRAAADAASISGTDKAIKALAELLKSKDNEKVQIASQFLKSIKGNIASPSVAGFEVATPEGKAAILDIVRARKARDYKSLVYKNLNADNETVKVAAYKAIAEVSEMGDLDRLYRLLEGVDAKYVKYVQNSIYNAMLALDNSKKYDLLTEKIKSGSASAQSRYNEMIIHVANTGQLFNICKNATDNALFNNAFSSYVSKVNASKQPGAQSLLELRKIMDYARSNDQKVQVLNGVARTNTFLGILFAGKYLDEKPLAQAAAAAIRKIATNNKEFNSPEVTALLKRCLDVIEGGDAIYEKSAIKKHLAELPAEEGFVPMFNGKDLTGWKGLVGNPVTRAKMSAKELAKAQEKADQKMNECWKVQDGTIVFNGKGENLCTEKQYGNFEMYVDWKLDPAGPEADAGIYLRGTPQVQIWDTARTGVGAQVGSGGLYNNKKNASKPLVVADNALGDWNSFYIKMVGERVTVYLNGQLVVNNVIMENYWDRTIPVFLKEQIELQAHGSKVSYRDLYIKELPFVEPVKLSAEEEAEGFELLFDGTSLHKFKGNTTDYQTDGGCIAVRPTGQGFGNLYTAEQYDDFCFRFEFKLTPGANNGVGIRTPDKGDAAYVGMEIQVLDHYNPIYQPNLRPYQYHGSVYGIIPAQRRDALKPVGEWNEEEIYIKGTYIRVTVNGIVVTEGDLAEATNNWTTTYDKLKHPGVSNKSGYIGFLGHGSKLWYRNIRIKKLK